MKGRDWTSGTAAALSIAAMLAFASPASAADGDRIQPRIVGGEPTTTTAHPWQAALVFDAQFEGLLGNDFERQFCAGSLITPRIVQTAAHCVFDGIDPDDGFASGLEHDDVDLILGRTTLTDTAAGEELDVKGDLDGIYVDPEFDPDTFDHDFAWIVLAADSAQQPIKIAGPGENALWDPGSPTEATGWGEDETGDASDTLRAAILPIASDAVCDELYGPAFLSSSMICAGYTTGAADACFGDSGGPLQAPAQGGVYRLVGGVSWGDHFCSNLGVYSRAVAFDLQTIVDGIEADEALTDGGPIVGTGATPPPPPPNDDFAAAQGIGASFAAGASGESFDATLEVGEPNHDGGGASVWYRWTAPTSGSTTVSLCGSNFDTLLAVYGGASVGALGPRLAWNDDASDECNLGSAATFASTARSTYRIAVDGFGGAVGEVELSLTHATTPVTPTTTAPEDLAAVPTTPPTTKRCPKGKKLKKGRCVKKKRKRSKGN